MIPQPQPALNVLIVDDEQPARRRLRKLLQPIASSGRVCVVAEASDGVEALEKLLEHDIHLLFLDIQMPELNGFDILDQLPSERRPVVVFTTAYDAYALRAFEANAVDYLLKPISKRRLSESVSRAERLCQVPETRSASDARLSRLLDWIDTRVDTAENEPSTSPEYLRQISISCRDRILIIPIERLVSAEIQEGITRLFILDEEPGAAKPRMRQHVVNYTLDQLESNLDPAHFMRVHRSAIVQLNHIQEMISWFSGRYKLILTGEHEVVASRERSRHLKEQLML